MLLSTLILSLSLTVGSSIQAADLSPGEWTAVRYALGTIESGNADTARGAAGEITRFQILPQIYVRHGGIQSRIRDESHTWTVTQGILRDRLSNARPVGSHRISPEMLYLLWNAPRSAALAHYDFRQIKSPTLRDRATRFANLYRDAQH